MDILNFILGLRQQRQQQQQMGYLDEIMAQAMKPKDVGMEQVAPSPGVSGMGYEPGIFYGEPKIERPQFQDALPNIMNEVMGDPRLQFETKMRVAETFKKSEGKRHVLKEGENLVDDEGKVIAEGPKKKEKPKLITVSPGQKIIDETGNVKFEAPGKPEAPKTRELKHKTEIITQEFDSKTQTWKEISRAPREIEKPGEISDQKKKQISIWKEGINSRLGKYSPLGSGIVVSLAEGFDLGEARNAYTIMKKEAGKGNLVAKRDLQAVDHWIDQIGKTVGEPKNLERQGKQLDQATAKTILQEAGGDKKKAREIAKQRGYKF